MRCVVVGLVMVGCGDDDDQPAPSESIVTRRVGPTGGTVALPNGASVSVPAGALTTGTEITVEVLPSAMVTVLPGSVRSAGPAVAFLPHGQVFARPVTITLPYVGIEPDVRPLRLPRANADALEWTAPTPYAVDDVRWQISLDVLTFSVYVPVRGDLDAGVVHTPDGATAMADARVHDAADDDGGQVANDPTPVNPDCPDHPPTSGPRAMKGKCCFRRSNAERAQAAWHTGGHATLEFRQSTQVTYSQPSTIGLRIIQAALADTYSNELNNVLVRIAGVPATGSGPVIVTVGAGRPNCDGTYSFYGPGAAPTHEGRTDADRWAARSMGGTWDWDSPSKLTIPLSERVGGVQWYPVARTQGEFGHEEPWQDVSYDIAMETTATGASTATSDDLNCVGGELDRVGAWDARMLRVAYAPVAALMAASFNSTAVVQNQCSLIALGYMRQESCQSVAREMWQERPSGKCNPQGHCYVGDENDPHADCGTSSQPCCDPRGVDTTKPACDAFVFQSRVVLSATEIRETFHTDAGSPVAGCYH